MDNYIEHYLEFRKGKVTELTYKDDKYLLGVAKKYFKDKDIVDNRIGRIEQILDTVAKDYTADKSNRVRKKMQQVIDYLIRYDLADIRHNVFKTIKPKQVPQKEKKQKHFFESHNDVPSEHHTITRLYEVAETPQDKLLILFCAITGGRINEVQNIKWIDINLKDKDHAFMRIKNSKINVGGKSVKDEFRLMDINPLYVKKILEQKKRIPQLNDKSLKCEDGLWEYVITTQTGKKPSYVAIYKRYIALWKKVYELYKDHAEYPFPYGADPRGFTFHAFRRHYVCSYRDSFGDEYSKAHHERLQMMIGHKIGSSITDDIYTHFNNEKVVQKQMNSKINLGVRF